MTEKTPGKIYNEAAARRWWARERRVQVIGFWVAVAVLGFGLAAVRGTALWLYDVVLVTHDPLWLLMLVGITGTVATLVTSGRIDHP